MAMFCPQCGSRNEDGSVHCSQCGTRLGPQPAGNQPMQPYGQPPQGMMSSQQPQFGQPYQQMNQQPGAGQFNPAAASGVQSYMTQAILMTCCCCMPLGIWSIFKASRVNRLLAMGDYAGAALASKENKTLLWIALGLGVVVNVIVFVANFIGGMHSVQNYQ